MDVRVQGAGRGDECSVILESNQLPIFSISFTVQKIGRFSAVCRAGQVQISVSNTNVDISAVKRSIGSTTGCTITEKAPTRTFSWLKGATTAFTFKTLLRHYAKRALTPRSLNVKLGPRRNYHKGRAAIRHYANQPARPL